MARVKRGLTSHRKHKKLHALTKGYRGGRGKLVKEAKSALLHAGEYAFAGRKMRKRYMRRLWITQLGIAAKQEGLSYSKLINQLNSQKIKLDRKILAELAVNHPENFKQIINEIRA